MTDLARTAIELRDLVERFASLSDGALRACATGDTAVLAATLDARDLVLSRACALSREVNERRERLDSTRRDALEALLRPVRHAAEEAARANHRLQGQVATARLDIGRQLDLLNAGAGATAAYQPPGGPSGRAPTLDTVR